MRARRRTNLLWGVVLVAAAVFLLLRAFDVMPEGLEDILWRAWPAMLVLAGLSTLLRGRAPLGGLVALVLSVVLVAGVAQLAYSSRATQQRDDQQQIIAEEISETVNLLAVNVDTATTDIEFVRSSSGDNMVSGQFTGSTESEISIRYIERDDGVAEFTLVEEKMRQFHLLEAVGRGTLRLELPLELPIAVAIVGENGNATLNMSDLALERLTLELDRGNIVVTLPEYQPQSSDAEENPGQVATANGDVTVFVPETVSVRMELNRGGNDIRPEFDETYILIDDGADGTLEMRNPDEAVVSLYYVVTAPRGLISLEVVSDE